MRIFNIYWIFYTTEATPSVNDNVNIFWNRFFLIVLCFIVPSVVIFATIVHKHLFKKDIFLIYENLSKFKPYKYFLHNVAFCFCVFIILFYTIFFIFSAIDAYLCKFIKIYKLFWHHLDDETKKFPESHFFWQIIFVGYLLNLVSSCLYLHYNLYKTDSFFSEWWELRMKIFKSSKSFKYIEKYYPNTIPWIKKHILEFNRNKKDDQDLVYP